MSEERNVMCPWCGWDMVAREAQDIFHGKYNVYVCEACEAVSPIAYSDKAAYAAATATPPSRPLTRQQVEAMPKNTPVWVYTHGGNPYALRTAEECRHLTSAYYIFECARPTPADIAAARAGEGEENAD